MNGIISSPTKTPTVEETLDFHAVTTPQFDMDYLRDQAVCRIFVGDVEISRAVTNLPDDGKLEHRLHEYHRQMVDAALSNLFKPSEQQVAPVVDVAGFRAELKRAQDEIRDLRLGVEALHEQINAPGAWRRFWNSTADLWRELRNRLARKIEP